MTRTFVQLDPCDDRLCLRPTDKKHRCLRQATHAAILTCEDGRRYEVTYCEGHGREAKEDFKGDD